MNIVCLKFLLYAFCANVTLAYLIYRPRAPFSTKHTRSITQDAGEPLLLTPLLDAGKLEKARNRSRVTPFLDDIESYAGYFTVNETTASHLYFWFIPKTDTNYTSSPVILWLQGGPGCSSLYGLFNENGPFSVAEEGVRRRVHAWTNNYNMLYIDQPVGTGFSFTEHRGYVSTEEEVGEHLYAALVQFFKLFSEFKEHDFYIAGESYAGKFISAVGRKIHAVSEQPLISAALPALKGMMIGNAFTDPENMLDYATFLHATGHLDGKERQQMELVQDKVRYYIQSGNWSQAAQAHEDLFEDLDRFTGLPDTNDYTRNELFTDDDAFVHFITHDRRRKRLHVGHVKYEACSMKIYYRLKLDIVRSARPTIEQLLHRYPMLFYSGQFDVLCSHWLIENCLDKLHWRGAAKYALAEKRVWRVGDKVAGYYRSADNLVHALVRNAGHVVLKDQPENALDLINRFIEKKLFDNSTRSVE